MQSLGLSSLFHLRTVGSRLRYKERKKMKLSLLPSPNVFFRPRREPVYTGTIFIFASYSFFLFGWFFPSFLSSILASSFFEILIPTPS